jgi:hypothetical protein
MDAPLEPPRVAIPQAAIELLSRLDLLDRRVRILERAELKRQRKRKRKRRDEQRSKRRVD